MHDSVRSHTYKETIASGTCLHGVCNSECAHLNQYQQLDAKVSVHDSIDMIIRCMIRPSLALADAARALSCCTSLQQHLQQRYCANASTYTPNNDNRDEDNLFVGIYTPVTKQLWLERLRMVREQQHQAPSAAEAAAQPEGKPPQVTQVVYPFTKDKFLLEMYRNPWGFLRMGRLLEDLDSLAGSVAFQHCHTPGSGPPLLVTAAVDAIEYQHPAVLNKDMICQGQVVYTGGSSLDIRMELLQEPYAPEPSLVALFSFVLLDSQTKKPTKVPQLLPQTDQEKHWAAERAQVAAARKAARQAEKASGRIQLSPAQRARLQEAVTASQLLVDMPALADPMAITPEETSLSNTFVCQPQQRNMHGRIFGGFLMRRAFELAFSTTYMFAGSRPAFVRVEDITFRNPVDVGSLLRFKSHVVDVTYTSTTAATPAAAATQPEAHIAVEVEAVVSQPEKKTTIHTNLFRYVFSVKLNPGQHLRKVLPATPADVDRLSRYLAESD